MASSNEANPTRFTAVFLMAVSDVGSLLAQKKTLYSSSFTCPNDPQPVRFKLRLGFGTGTENGLEARVMAAPLTRNITIYKLRIIIYDRDMKVLKDISSNQKYEYKPGNKGKGYGWENHHSLAGNVDLKVMCEVVYGSPPETNSEPFCDLPPHHHTHCRNMLDLLNDPEDADVTFRVASEEIKAHKAILTARSAYFRGLFKSGMKESLSKEVELDDDPAIFKEVLKFLYSGSLPENMDEIAMALFPVADKYALDDLKQACETAIRRNVSAENVIEVLRLAEMLDRHDLFEYASPIFWNNLQDSKQKFWDELGKESRFLAKLFNADIMGIKWNREFIPS